MKETYRGGRQCGKVCYEVSTNINDVPVRDVQSSNRCGRLFFHKRSRPTHDAWTTSIR